MTTSFRMVTLNFRLKIVESIPTNLTYDSGPQNEKTHEAWLDLLRSAEKSIRIASFYWSLRDSGGYPTSGEVQQVLFKHCQLNFSNTTIKTKNLPPNSYSFSGTKSLWWACKSCRKRCSHPNRSKPTVKGFSSKRLGWISRTSVGWSPIHRFLASFWLRRFAHQILDCRRETCVRWISKHGLAFTHRSKFLNINSRLSDNFRSKNWASFFKTARVWLLIFRKSLSFTGVLLKARRWFRSRLIKMSNYF